MTTTHLTPAELDALLEAARAATPGPWHGAKHDVTMIVAADRARVADCSIAIGMTREEQETNAAFIVLANPATIERLVLMVRAMDTVWRTAVKERDAATDALGKHYEELEIRAVEHFRAQTVRALRNQRAEIVPVEDAAVGIEDAARLIESLPLVETEDK